DLPGIAELRATGLLDPVDDAYDELMGEAAGEDGADDTERSDDPEES
ncbi:MAG TPA: SMC-Scp complex subunit ScpB, partial [Erythrobacter sp.]|nr:SMC-Scp complex subunit ScpB [Erythrobacter sp.]